MTTRLPAIAIALALAAPLLAQPENYRGVQTRAVIAPPLAETGVVYAVNQQRPIALAWSPQTRPPLNTWQAGNSRHADLPGRQRCMTGKP